MKQHAVARLDCGQVEDQRIGHRVAEGHCGRIVEAHGVRNFVHVLGGHGHQFGPCLELGQSDHAVADGKFSDTLAEGFHLAGALKTEDARRLGWRRNGAETDDKVLEVETAVK